MGEAVSGDVNLQKESRCPLSTCMRDLREKDVSWIDRGRRRSDVRALTYSPNGITKTPPCSSVPTNSYVPRSFGLSILTIRGLYSPACAVKLEKEGGT